ncbi:MAG: hypothetical protein KDD94_00950 [Calditrichaeota bacterium]|nr:hypothetical protein [Calditrichota bacterium]
MLTKILQICIAIMCLLILFVLLWDLQQRSLQGNNMLSQADLSVDSVRINSIQQGKRFESDIQLIADKDSINFSISRPIESDLLRLPVIIVLGGFQSGKKSLEYISEKGANIPGT